MKGTLNEILSKGPKFEENILKAFENRKLVFFIGAGVSRIMGIMGWDDFSAFLVRKAFPDFKDNNAILRDVPSSKERITVAYKKFEQEGRLSDFYKYFPAITMKNRIFYHFFHIIFQKYCKYGNSGNPIPAEERKVFQL